MLTLDIWKAWKTLKIVYWQVQPLNMGEDDVSKIGLLPGQPKDRDRCGYSHSRSMTQYIYGLLRDELYDCCICL